MTLLFKPLHHPRLSYILLSSLKLSDPNFAHLYPHLVATVRALETLVRAPHDAPLALYLPWDLDPAHRAYASASEREIRVARAALLRAADRAGVRVVWRPRDDWSGTPDMYPRVSGAFLRDGETVAAELRARAQARGIEMGLEQLALSEDEGASGEEWSSEEGSEAAASVDASDAGEEEDEGSAQDDAASAGYASDGDYYADMFTDLRTDLINSVLASSPPRRANAVVRPAKPWLRDLKKRYAAAGFRLLPLQVDVRGANPELVARHSRLLAQFDDESIEPRDLHLLIEQYKSHSAAAVDSPQRAASLPPVIGPDTAGWHTSPETGSCTCDDQDHQRIWLRELKSKFPPDEALHPLDGDVPAADPNLVQQYRQLRASYLDESITRSDYETMPSIYNQILRSVVDANGVLAPPAAAAGLEFPAAKVGVAGMTAAHVAHYAHLQEAHATRTLTQAEDATLNQYIMVLRTWEGVEGAKAASSAAKDAKAPRSQAPPALVGGVDQAKLAALQARAKAGTAARVGGARRRRAAQTACAGAAGGLCRGSSASIVGAGR
ncbi:hypothetical protein JCM10449v2_003325 [Rhodotorula kratochvilovae]